MTTALITGATSGIGAAFAERLARDGHDLVLVARTEATLQETAVRLRGDHDVDVETLVADLADREALTRVADRVADASRPIDLLVNNAGYGSGLAFLENDVDDEERAIDVMVRAVMVLSHAAGLAMGDRGYGAIINVSSVASFLTSGTYSAAKAWVTAFSEGLAYELTPRGVVVTALCPGLTRTDFHRRAGIEVTDRTGPWLEADQVVAECLADVRRRKVVSVPGRGYKATVAMLDVLPRPLVRFLSNRGR